jgi:outer membrane protein TolC
MSNAKKYLPFVLILFTNIGLLSAQSESYSLEDYLRKVQARNHDIAFSRQDVLLAEETVKQARSALLPSVGTSGGYTRNFMDREQSTAVGAGVIPSGSMYPLVYRDVDANYDNELTAGLGIEQKIFDAAALMQYQQAKKSRAMRETVSDYTGQMIITTAKKLYARAQLAQAVSDVMKEAEKTSEETYRNIQKMYAAGTSTELNVLMAEVDWKNNITASVEAERNSALAMLALKDLAGIAAETEMTLTEETRRIPEMPSMPDINKVLAFRPDYRTQLLGRELADLTFRAALGTFLPTVSARFSYAYGQQGGYKGKSNWNALNYSALQLNVTVSIPLFTGGYRASLVKSANISRTQADINIQKSKNAVEQEITSLILYMREARQKLESAETLEAAALRAMALAQASLENGLGTRLTVTEANTNLARTRLNFQSAIFEYRSAYYDWQLAIGQGGELR